MQQIELSVPKAIEILVDDERERLLRTALRIAARQRAHELVKERREALTHIHRYERKYSASFATFERRKLRALSSTQAHEDYNDWFFWTQVLLHADTASNVLKKMETVK
jgi:hypothetical protein